MKWKTYRDDNNFTDVVEHILYNRGIENPNEYLHLSDDNVIDYNNLDNIHEAVECFSKHYEKLNRIAILVDSDVDGYCSASMMYLYIKALNEDYPVEYILHNRTKAHGLQDINIDENINLLIIPDASTNDTKECEMLKNNGIDVIILDHHEKELENPYAIVVNNQCSDTYSNKDFCGAGIVYKFLQALDEQYWVENADTYLDLVALANISDVMDIRSYETRYLIDKGLKQIKNKAFQALINAQDYSMNGIVNIHNIQWYITPVINGCIRMGSDEEKELLFKAFIEQDEYFEYKKRATKNKPSEVIQESIYDRSARLSKNAKSRQDKVREKSVAKIAEVIDENKLADNKVVMLDATNYIENSGLSGVVAIKIADIYHKPCVLLNKFIDDDDNGKVKFGGSARNINYSPIDSFKDVVNSNNAFNFARGHQSAFGINMDIDKIDKAQTAFNKLLKDIEYDNTYRIDYDMTPNNVDVAFITQIDRLKDIVGQGIEEPLILIKNVYVMREDVEIFGKNEDTISFTIGDVKYIKFKCTEDDELLQWANENWADTAYIDLNIIGKPNISEYKGFKTPQVTILDYEILGVGSDVGVDCGFDDDEDVW